jgi:hypothetical protein
MSDTEAGPPRPDPGQEEEEEEAGPPKPPGGDSDAEEEEDVGPARPAAKKRKVCVVRSKDAAEWRSACSAGAPSLGSEGGGGRG